VDHIKDGWQGDSHTDGTSKYLKDKE